MICTYILENGRTAVLCIKRGVIHTLNGFENRALNTAGRLVRRGI